MDNPLLTAFVADPLFLAPEFVSSAGANLAMLHAFLMSDPRGQQILAGSVSGDDNGDDFWPADDDRWMMFLRPYKVSGGTLQIPVQGVLLAGFPYAFGSYATGYQYIERAFKRGMNDPAVERIALVINSPGGMVSECFDTVDEMAAMSGKPVRSFAADSAYSAAYALAGVGDQIIVTRTGGVGSIGVVTAHIDASGAMGQMGLKVTFVSAPEGGFKTEGNPYEPLSDEAKARMQARINDLYEVFVASVAANRDLDEQAVRDTQALCFSAGDAITNGLADSVGRLDKGLAAFAAETATTGATAMADVKEADHIAAVAAATEKGTAAGHVAGSAAERTRISAIMESDEAKTRPVAARELAFATDMPVDKAKAFLAKLPEEKATTAEPPPKGSAARALFDAAMSKDNPGIKSGAGAGNDDEEDGAAAILRDYALAGGKVRERKTA